MIFIQVDTEKHVKTGHIFDTHIDMTGFTLDFHYKILSMSKLTIGSLLPSKSMIYSPNLFIWLVKYGLKFLISCFETSF